MQADMYLSWLPDNLEVDLGIVVMPEMLAVGSLMEILGQDETGLTIRQDHMVVKIWVLLVGIQPSSLTRLSHVPQVRGPLGLPVTVTKLCLGKPEEDLPRLGKGRSFAGTDLTRTAYTVPRRPLQGCRAPLQN